MRCRFGAHLWIVTRHLSHWYRAHFEDELTEEATWASHSQPFHVHFAADPQEGFTSTPRKLPEKQHSRASLNPTTYPPSYEMKMVV